MRQHNNSEQFFESKYSASRDPWNFETSAYEELRYNLTILALEQRFFKRAFEPGCSIGLLTARLAEWCNQVDAIDISATAVEEARLRCRNLPNVHILRGELPADTPAGVFDLMVLSEIGYYFDQYALSALLNSLISRLSPGGTLLAVHWLGESADHKIDGDAVHGVIRSIPGLLPTEWFRYVKSRQERFLLERWTRL